MREDLGESASQNEIEFLFLSFEERSEVSCVYILIQITTHPAPSRQREGIFSAYL